MKISRIHWLRVIVMVLALALVWLLFQWLKPLKPPIDDTRSIAESHSPSSVITPKLHAVDHADEPAKEQREAFLGAFLTPIVFYGRVIDQNSNPIEDAKVETTAQDSPLGDGTSRTQRTDVNGLFTVSGIRGANLLVRVAKKGYHQLTEFQGKQHNQPPSQKGFAYAWDRGSGIHLPDKASPQVFMLYKPNNIEPLLSRPEVSWYLKPGGGSTVVSLHPDRSSSHAIKIECKVTPDDNQTNQPYDWKLEVSAVGGKVLAHNELFPFEAPADGYGLTDVVSFEKSLPPNQWKDRIIKHYFVRFNDGCHARIEIECYARQKPLIVLQSWLNVKPGSRNLATTPSE